ncbi:MAG: recombination mediator RecR [Myxococcota bacterium]|nr:recombination mediator RecR [Myxococcota bacterium]
MSSEPLDRVIHLLSRLPGVGRKTATRHAFTILKRGEGYAQDLAAALVDLAQNTTLCSSCQNFSSEPICRICLDEFRQAQRICVVQSPADVTAIESAGAWRGVYHVLHGVIAPLDGVGPDDLKIPELLSRMESSEVTEVVLATGASVEGEATAVYLSRLLSPLCTVTRLARGLPAGGDLEYLDAPTLTRAFEGRRQLD